jgi:hypothetical protein
MNIKTNLRAGACYTTEQGCYAQRDFWKNQANKMELYAKGAGSATGLYVSANPPKGYTGYWMGQYVTNAPMSTECINTTTGQPVTPPTTTPPTTVPPTGGGYVGNVFYPDLSGVCSTGTKPPTTTPGGGYVAGVYYPDRSGVCGAV